MKDDVEVKWFPSIYYLLVIQVSIAIFLETLESFVQRVEIDTWPTEQTVEHQPLVIETRR